MFDILPLGLVFIRKSMFSYLFLLDASSFASHERVSLDFWSSFAGTCGWLELQAWWIASLLMWHTTADQSWLIVDLPSTLSSFKCSMIWPAVTTWESNLECWCRALLNMRCVLFWNLQTQGRDAVLDEYKYNTQLGPNNKQTILRITVIDN